MNTTRICTVNGNGDVTFSVKGWIPDVIPKVKHEPRELHPDYAGKIRKRVEIRVKVKKRQLEEELVMKQAKQTQKLKDFEKYRFNIDKWWEEGLKGIR